ncbi:hypothetical protein RHMOL_Rhmol01G0132000 [Rhododendron molle]|uniref:Uncharacterized protein n=1 Tax=Rhododendron molle TaxID=49168 RepID=A0ACC0Q2C5_RHOML|nr:hypothetical protein RHMOL_Rhmol01G0132000 [Rhododendron molle]
MFLSLFHGIHPLSAFSSVVSTSTNATVIPPSQFVTKHKRREEAMEAKMGNFFNSVAAFFGGGDHIPWSDCDTIFGCEREVVEVGSCRENHPTVQQQLTVRQQPCSTATAATLGLGVPMQNPLYVPIPAVPEGSRVEIGDDRQKSKKEAEDRKVASQLSS